GRRIGGAEDVAIQPDGKLVLLGWQFPPDRNTSTRFSLVRFLPDGRIDRSFSRDGFALIGLRAGQFPKSLALQRDGKILVPGGGGTGVLIQPDGRILVAGVAYDDDWDSGSAWAILRYLPNGRLDHAFGHGGTVIGDFGTGLDWASSLELQPDGKLLVAGSIYE